MKLYEDPITNHARNKRYRKWMKDCGFVRREYWVRVTRRDAVDEAVKEANKPTYTTGTKYDDL